MLLDHAGGAAPTTLAADITNVATAATLNAAVSWPSGGAAGDFYITINRGKSNEERCRVGSRTGTSLSSMTRGVDGTSATSHTAGESVEHTFSGEEIDDLNTFAFAADQITSANIAAGAVGSSELAAGAVTAGKIGVGGISAANQFAAGVVDAAAIATDAVGSAEIAALAVGTAELADLSVTAGKIAADTITAGQIAADAVGTSELGPLAVTSAELAAASVTAGKIAAGGVSSTAEIAAAIITLAKLASEAPSTWTVTFANVTLGTGGATWRGYFKLGRLVIGWCGFNLGTSGGDVTGTISFNLPVTPADLTGGIFAGVNTGNFVVMRASQSAVNTWAALGRIDSSGNATAFATTGTNASYDATTPFNWSNNDHAECLFAYVATA